MVSCSSFATELECALTVQQDFNMKLILLLTLLGFIMYSLYKNRDMMITDDSNSFDIFKYWTYIIFPKVILYTYPLLLLTLRDTVSFEVVITGLIIFYMLITGIFIGILLYYGKEYIMKLMGLDVNVKFV